MLGSREFLTLKVDRVYKVKAEAKAEAKVGMNDETSTEYSVRVREQPEIVAWGSEQYRISINEWWRIANNWYVQGNWIQPIKNNNFNTSVGTTYQGVLNLTGIINW